MQENGSILQRLATVNSLIIWARFTAAFEVSATQHAETHRPTPVVHMPSVAMTVQNSLIFLMIHPIDFIVSCREYPSQNVDVICR